MTIASHAGVHPYIQRYQALYDLGLVLGGSLLLALSAQVAIYLPFSPVPITAQTLAVLLIGATLGSRRGALSVSAYLLEGFSGLPVFAGGQAGLLYALGPTGGYLAGFVAAALVTGELAERGWDRRIATCFLALLAGNVSIYSFGLLWLARLIGPDKALALGLAPFIPGDLVKLGLGMLLLPAAWKLMTIASARQIE